MRIWIKNIKKWNKQADLPVQLNTDDTDHCGLHVTDGSVLGVEMFNIIWRLKYLNNGSQSIDCGVYILFSVNENSYPFMISKICKPEKADKILFSACFTFQRLDISERKIFSYYFYCNIRFEVIQKIFETKKKKNSYIPPV